MQNICGNKQSILRAVFWRMFPTMTGLFQQFIIPERSFSGELTFQSVSSRSGKESYTSDENKFGEEEEYSGSSRQKVSASLSET